MNWNAYRGRGALFLRFVSITNGRGGGGGGEEVSCAQWKTDSQAGFNSFHRAADFRQCRHSTGISTTQTLVPPFRSPPRPFQHGNRFPPKRAFACHRPPNEHGPFQPPPPSSKLQKRWFDQNDAPPMLFLPPPLFLFLPSPFLSTKRIRNREEFSSSDSPRICQRIPLINRDDKRIRFSASFHGDQSSGDKDAISVSHGLEA